MIIKNQAQTQVRAELKIGIFLPVGKTIIVFNTKRVQEPLAAGIVSWEIPRPGSEVEDLLGIEIPSRRIQDRSFFTRARFSRARTPEWDTVNRPECRLVCSRARRQL